MRGKRGAAEDFFSDERFQPLSFPALFEIRKRLFSPQPGSGANECLSEEGKKLREALRITKKELAKVARKCGGLKNKLVLFNTGWDYFAPRNADLGHPYWVGLHPHFWFPSLDPDAVSYLCEEDVLGVGVDALGLERQEWMWKMNPLLSDWEMPGGEDGFGRFHKTFLKDGRLVIENLRIPAYVYASGPSESALTNLVRSKAGLEDGTMVTGRALIVPFAMSPAREAIVTNVYFQLQDNNGKSKQ